LDKFAKTPTLVTYNPNDAEASSFATDLATALHAAKWDVSEPLAMLSLREGPMTFGTNSRPPTGVLIWSIDDDSSRQAAMQLLQQLTNHGFDAVLSPDIRGSLAVRSTIRVVVAVEHKPEGAQGEYKLRTQKAASQ
jgi:hypothetical protein